MNDCFSDARIIGVEVAGVPFQYIVLYRVVRY